MDGEHLENVGWIELSGALHLNSKLHKHAAIQTNYLLLKKQYLVTLDYELECIANWSVSTIRTLF